MDKSVKKKKRSENQRRLFFQSRHTDGQEAHEKILNITNYWRNVSRDTCPDTLNLNSSPCNFPALTPFTLYTVLKTT